MSRRQMMLRFVLASSSPRRRELLERKGYRFTVASPEIEELTSRSLTGGELALCNAVRKGLSIARATPEGVVLAADTVVAIDGTVFGKPADLKEAETMLRCLSGRGHRVCSAVFICQLERARLCSFQEISHVHFRRLTNAAIRDYLAEINPLDKAGAYAAQDDDGRIIARIEGSFTNVVGLPMEKTVEALRLFGVEPRPASGSRPLRDAKVPSSHGRRGAGREKGTKQ